MSSNALSVSSVSSSAAKTGSMDSDASSVIIVMNARKPDSVLVITFFALFCIAIFPPYILYVISVMMLLTSPIISETRVANSIIMNMMNPIPTIVPIVVSIFFMKE